MSTQTGVGVSHIRNPVKATEEAVASAMSEAGLDEAPDLVMMFATTSYEQQTLVDAVRTLTNDAILVGCSGPGIIAKGIGDEGPFSLIVGVREAGNDTYSPVDESSEMFVGLGAMARMASSAINNIIRHDELLTSKIHLEERVLERTAEIERSKELLEQAVARQNVFLDNALVGILMMQNSKVAGANKRFCEMFGYEDEGEVLVLESTHFYPTQEAHDQMAKRVFTDMVRGDPIQVEVVLKRKDGSSFWGRIAARFIDTADISKGSIWILSDITDEVKSKEELEKQRSLLDAFVTYSPSVVFIKDREGMYLLTNSVFEELFHLPPVAPLERPTSISTKKR